MPRPLRPRLRSRPRVSLPPALSREWKRLPSSQFTIVGTSSAKDLAQLAVELETFLAVLQQMTPSLRLASPVPTYVVALKDFGAFTNYQPRGPDGRRMDWVAGYFSPGPDGNYLVAPWGGKDRESLAVMLHELTHHLANRNVGGIPTWLAEGVAEFYSTFRIDADRNLAIVGEPPKDRLRSLVGRSLMPLDRLFAVTNTNRVLRQPGGTRPVLRPVVGARALSLPRPAGRADPADRHVPAGPRARPGTVRRRSRSPSAAPTTSWARTW